MRSALTLFFVPIAACGGGGDPDLVAERELPAEVTADVLAVSHANNQFALDTLAVLPPDGNQFFSPFSITTALWMLDAGAAGDTDAELRGALRATLPGEQAHTAYGAMLDSLEIGRSFDLYTLATANRLFGQEGYGFLPSFLDLTGDVYGAPLQPVDFADTESARATINDWVSEQTDAKIPELLGPGTVTSDTRLALVNAILFKGKWVHQFSPADTKPETFTLATGEPVSVVTMQKDDDIAITQIDGGQLGVLPFRGNDLSMMILVPDAYDGLPALEDALTADSLATAIAAADAQPLGEDRENRVTLPKFTFETEIDLIEPLQALGVTSAFDPALADLSGIDGTRGLYVQTAVHKAVIAVDEEGAEAAAATAVGVGPVSLPPELRVDRPFVFFIYDHVTQSILFLGRVNDPR